MLLGRVIVDRIFGFDVFVSYSRRDGTAYAQQLEEELRRGGYRSFLDSKEMPAGEALTASLRNALKRSSALILVASPGALLSQYMPKEFDYYVEARQRPKIVPISIGRALDDAGPDLPLSQRVRARADVIWITEREEQLAKGPSAAVLKDLNDSFNFTRRNTLRERVITGVVVILLALLAIAVWQWSRAGQERDAARQTLSRSYFTRACRLLDSKNYYDGLAYLVAACRADPENASAAATRLFALLTERNWLLPLTPRMLHRTSKNKEQAIEQVRFSANGTRLVTTAITNLDEHEGVARVWDAGNGKLLVDAVPCNSSGEDEYTPFLPDADSFSPQADKLLVACKNKVELWDVEQAKTVGARTYDKNVTAARFLPPDGKTILVGTEDGTIQAFADGLETPLTSVKAGGKVERFSREGQLVLARYGKSAVQLLKAAPDWKTLQAVGSPIPAGELLAADDAFRLAVFSEAKSSNSSSETSKFLVWRPGVAAPVVKLSMPQGEGGPERASISPDLRQLVALATRSNRIPDQTGIPDRAIQNVSFLRTWISSESEPDNWQRNDKIKTHDATIIDPETQPSHRNLG